jgi:CheY-like chemotaxis protein
MLPGGKRDILVVDGNEDMLIALEWLLEGEGYRPTTAWSGREGLALLRSQRFDLVLLDNHLPDLDYRDILKALQRAPCNTPVIVMQSAEPAVGEADQETALGACGLVNKQMPHQISEAISKCLSLVARTGVGR